MLPPTPCLTQPSLPSLRVLLALQAAITRLQAILGEGSIEYVGGVKAFYPNLSSPIPNFDMEEGQIVGSVYLSYVNSSLRVLLALQAAITRLQAILGEGSIEYLGGVKAFYPNLVRVR